MTQNKGDKVFENIGLFQKELATLGNFIFNSEKAITDISFFSTQAQYFSYYQGLLEELIKRKNKITYLTGDTKVIRFFDSFPEIAIHYSKKLLPIAFPLLTSPVVVTTIPDIQQYAVKRSFGGINYVYVFHSLVSTHMMYRKGAFDYYDTVFCAGPYHADEIRRTEQVYNLPKKKLYEVGYYRLEKIHAQHQKYLTQEKPSKAQPLVLIAPGWQKDNIIDTCASELIRALLKEGFTVVLRPHPMTIAHQRQKLQEIEARFLAEKNFSVDIETSSEYYLHAADVMICDWSGVALEYAFGTERPVLFIDLPPKVNNPEYQRLGIEPFEMSLRNQIGKTIQPGQAALAGKIIVDFINSQKEYLEQILSARQNNIHNFGFSSSVGAEIIEYINKNSVKGWQKPF